MIDVWITNPPIYLVLAVSIFFAAMTDSSSLKKLLPWWNVLGIKRQIMRRLVKWFVSKEQLRVRDLLNRSQQVGIYRIELLEQSDRPAERVELLRSSRGKGFRGRRGHFWWQCISFCAVSLNPLFHFNKTSLCFPPFLSIWIFNFKTEYWGSFLL